VPIDPRRSTFDHFLPGLAVDRETAGAGAHLGLAYYYYPTPRCTRFTCRLNVGFISSTDGGRHWGPAARLVGPMANAWLAETSQGYMVGDYISTSFSSDGAAHPVFAFAKPPTRGIKDQAMYTPTVGLSPAASAHGG
jgi:hypothetical protein